MKSKIKTNKVLQAGMGYTIGNYLLKGINLITLPIFARLMNKTDYGLFNIYMSYEGIFVILIGVTLHSSLKNARYEFKNDYRKYVSSIEIVPMIMLAVALLIVNLFSGLVTQVTGLNLLTLDLLMIHSYCSALLQFYNADLSIDYKYTSFLKIAFFNTIANVLISLILMITVLSSKRYAARIAGCVVPLVLICIYILFKLFSSEKPKYNKTFWKFGVKYSLPIVPHGLSQIVLSQFDRIMINNMVGVAEAGIYSFAFNINTIIQILVNSLDSYEFIDLNIPKGNDTGKAKIKHYVSNAIYKIAGPKNIDKKRNDIFRKVSIESSDEIGLVSFLFNNNRRNYWKKEWALNCTNAPFEFLNVTVPIAADENIW